VSEDPRELPAERVVDRFESRHDGLTDDEVRRRLEEHGENDVVRSGGRSPIDIFVAQFDSVLIWVLLAAAVLSVWAGHTVDAVLIAIIVVANGIFGFVQDYRAEQSLESLRELASPTARVRRNGECARLTPRNSSPAISSFFAAVTSFPRTADCSRRPTSRPTRRR